MSGTVESWDDGDAMQNFVTSLRMTGIDRPWAAKARSYAGRASPRGHPARLYVEQFSRDGDQRPPYDARRPDVPL